MPNKTPDHVRAEKSRDMFRKYNPDSDKLALLIDGVEELNEQLRLALMIENTGEMTYRVQGIRRALRVITDNAKG